MIHNNQMTPQECKKVLEEIGNEITAYCYGKEKYDKALSYALTLIQENEELKKAIESAGEELPEKKEKTLHSVTEIPLDDGVHIKRSVRHFDRYSDEDKAFNQALDLCQPILAKYKLRVDKLEEDLKDQKNFAQDMIDTGADFEKERDKLQSQLSALRREQENLESDVGHYKALYEGQLSANKALRGKVSVEGKVWFGFIGESQIPPCYIILEPEKKYGFDSDTVFISDVFRKFAKKNVRVIIEEC